jgi:hypothetical protein
MWSRSWPRSKLGIKHTRLISERQDRRFGNHSGRLQPRVSFPRGLALNNGEWNIERRGSGSKVARWVEKMETWRVRETARRARRILEGGRGAAKRVGDLVAGP